ncbi:hypothetical protein A6A04_06640 [Paramagnetospirillum marisnigri]|uniref:Uncharacterized protein n=1 Tax=Paramagnetospirillum marisnigri TaxID=1285242 RepID=A0A178M9W1_9PROT|nr:hypothetical protein A6A04_06640 [Paramagnetospirillum marisnigri]
MGFCPPYIIIAYILYFLIRKKWDQIRAYVINFLTKCLRMPQTITVWGTLSIFLTCLQFFLKLFS